ncbi:MAG: hypothetical protein ABJB12_20750, partial [Pseudomonadota bacterium]
MTTSYVGYAQLDDRADLACVDGRQRGPPCYDDPASSKSTPTTTISWGALSKCKHPAQPGPKTILFP